MAYEFQPKDAKDIAKAYRAGSSSQALAEEWGVSVGVILRVLREQEVEIRPRGRRPAAKAK